jgi:hypothetical protein
MEAIPHAVLGNVYEFSTPETVLSVLCVNRKWRDSAVETYGDKVLELRKALQPIISRFSDETFAMFLASILQTGYSETSNFREILGYIKDTDINIINAVSYLFISDGRCHAEQFLVGSRAVLGDDCCKFFRNVMNYGYDTTPIKDMGIEYSNIKERFDHLFAMTGNTNSRVFHTLFLNHLRCFMRRDSSSRKNRDIRCRCCKFLKKTLDRMFQCDSGNVLKTLILSHDWGDQLFLKFLKVYVLLSKML